MTPSESTALLLPMAAMVALTFAVLLRLFATRARSVRAGALPASYFAVYRGAEEPDVSLQLARHFSNLFEAPTLFYAACLSALAIGAGSTALTVLAWAYVVCRAVHAWIHTGTNALRPRIGAYFASWAVLLSMWSVLIVGATRGA